MSQWYSLEGFKIMQELKGLVVCTATPASTFDNLVHILTSTFQSSFGKIEGWECPGVRIVETEIETGAEMNLGNY